MVDDVENVSERYESDWFFFHPPPPSTPWHLMLRAAVLVYVTLVAVTSG
jgi:hypothetical protein